MGRSRSSVSLAAWQDRDVDDVCDVTGVEAEVSVEIAAPSDLVWDLLADLSLTPVINRETLRTDWLTPSTGWTVGSVFRATNRIGEREWSVDCHVTVADRPGELGWTVLDPQNPSSTWWYRLEPRVGGGAQVTQGFRHGPNVSGLRWAVEAEPARGAQIVAGRIAMLTANMEYTLGRVAELATGKSIPPSAQSA